MSTGGPGSAPRAAVPIVQTVLGPVPATALGPTLMHEHLLIDIRCWHDDTHSATRDLRDEPVTAESVDSAAINALARRVSGITSVGLNAIEFVRDT